MSASTPELSPEQWQELSPYLEQALGLSDEQRVAWLSNLRTEKPDLADRVEELLREHQALIGEGFLENRLPRPASEPFPSTQTVGQWRLISRLGQGGMGTVWLAERADGRFERKVAIKFVQHSVVSEAAIERFRREGRILGQLAHPHIAELIDAGIGANGESYLVLEYIAGEPIDQYCDRHRLNVNARIRLFLDVLDAVIHAHENLVVHRDLKPSNVLVSHQGSAKLLDFGIAKLLAESGEGSATWVTLGEGAAMTPLFAAPEQLTDGPITTATDVYALGTLLFLLLTGQHPAGRGPHSPADLVRSITETVAPRPSDLRFTDESGRCAGSRSADPEKLRRQLRGDLDTIVLKALRKAPEERYRSAAAMAEDLRRYLAHEPVMARPDSLSYRMGKFIRRNRIAVGLAATAIAAGTAGVVGVLIQTHTAREQRDLAYRQVSRVSAISDLDNFLLADVAPGGKPFSVDALLSRAEHIVTRERVADNTDRVSLLISIGTQYGTEDEDANSRRVLEQAYALSRQLKDPSVRARAACSLASTLAKNGESARAETLIQSGLGEIPDLPQFALDRVFCFYRGREVADHNGAAELALERAVQAKRTLTASPFNSEVMQWHTEIELGEAYREAGRFREAIQSFQRGYSLMSDLGRDDTETAGTLLNNWALALEYRGHPLEAETRFARAIQLSRDNRGDQAVSPVLLVNYARVLRELGRTAGAVQYGEHGYDAAVKMGDQVITNQAMLELARIYREAGWLDRSNAMLDQVGLRLQKNLPPGHYAFSSLISERELNAQAGGDLAAASRLAETAMKMLQSAIDRGQQGAQFLPTLLGRQARLELQMGRSAEAFRDASAEVAGLQKNFEPGESSQNLGHAYMDLGMALEAQGKAEEARAAFRSASQNLEATLGSDHPDTLKARNLAAGLPTK